MAEKVAITMVRSEHCTGHWCASTNQKRVFRFFLLNLGAIVVVDIGIRIADGVRREMCGNAWRYTTLTSS